jgi:MSHA biogenesis protein MshP
MRQQQHGFALIAAIVLVVILAGLSAFVASMVSGQSANQQLERMTRVGDLAAQAGLEWGAYQVMRPALAPGCFPNGPLAAVLPGTLAPFTVNVTCAVTATTEPRPAPAVGTVVVYQITATATYGAIASPDYVERTKAAVFSR